MSLSNQAVLNSAGLQGWAFFEDISGGPTGASTVQAGATPVRGEGLRITKGIANGSVIMKSVLSGDAAPMAFIVNDGANAVNFFPAVGEFNNGVVNQVLAVPAGQSLLAIRVPNNLAGSSSGWRSTAIP
jgi:hypothetical protein